jgi:hypothetical protein
MFWFVLDDMSTPIILRDENVRKTYPLLDIIKRPITVSLDLDEQDSEDISDEDTTSTRHSSRVSDLMIAIFFNQVEGPDRDWGTEYSTGEEYEF